MKHWLAAGLVAPEHEVLLARTFLVKRAASLFAAREAELPKLTTGDGRMYIPILTLRTFSRSTLGIRTRNRLPEMSWMSSDKLGVLRILLASFGLALPRSRACL
jgi:hypothetical protein